ncbi:hypothetical protein [Pseudomonas brassicacearum]|nr:hypothetical protein [Pseudomonas brassicacearum]
MKPKLETLLSNTTQRLEEFLSPTLNLEKSEFFTEMTEETPMRLSQQLI